MTDTVQAREAAISAETKVEQLFNSILDKLHHLNSQLLDLHDQIKKAQPVASGSVCLELYPCGTGCSGCPHPRWVKYYWTPAKGDKPGILYGTNLDAQKRDPILTLQRSEPHYDETAKLIRRAKAILKDRAKLLASVRGLRYSAKLPST